MGVGGLIEPLVVVALLFGGAYVNRNKNYKLFARGPRWERTPSLPRRRSDSLDHVSSPSTSDGLLEDGLSRITPSNLEPTWRRRQIEVLSLKVSVTSPNTRVFKDYFLSRVLLKFPFLAEVWYWALLYWVYQLGRAFTAVHLVEGTVHLARRHALQLIEIERKLHLFWEPTIQREFLKHELLMHWINRIYSYVHIPATIFFLVVLYYYTTVRNRLEEPRGEKNYGEVDGSPAGPKLYEARRRTMAVCNLLAFIVFTAWPCMPPRLLSDPSVDSLEGTIARSYGFVDTVHGAKGEASVWTQNKFCNQYAAMPSLHFGYALMIGLTIAMIPLAPRHRRSRATSVPILGRCRLPSLPRLLCVFLGFSYAFIILVAIISTANHFILDAIAGACVCGLGWWANRSLLNLLPLEDYFLWCVKIHKPDRYIVEVDEQGVRGQGVLDR